MSSTVPLDAALATLLRCAESVPSDATVFTSLPDDELLAAQRSLAAVRRAVDTASAVVAGEVGRRSDPSLGHSGLAQRSGFRTPEKLVQHETGSTARDAVTLVKAGSLVLDAHEPTPSGAAWMREVGLAVAAGTLSVAAATAIQAGLGAPSIGVTAEQLADAASTLVALPLDADAMFKRARELRDDLDEAGIIEREREIYEQRSVRRVRRPNGLNRYIVDADLESTAFLDSLYDSITSPRRGGPRFVDPADKEWADAVVADGRTTDQYVHDAFLQVLRTGSAADVSRIVVGSRAPAVRLLATVSSLEAANRAGASAGRGSTIGHGRIEGLDIPVSISTIERNACDVGTLTIDFFTGQPIDVGREQRLFTARQRIALAARDGGCRWPGCDRPPSWTEAHHIRHWKRDHGPTDIVNGILLCRHHHLLLHDNGWEITLTGSDYWLVPPADIDPHRVPREMPSKSAALRDLQREATG
jgi:hypothetical protein